MDKLENLRAGVEEMRSVAQKLLVWADDLEKSFGRDAPVEEAVPVAEAPESAPAADKPVTRAEVKSFLTTLCAKGYAAQVKDLIASFGAKTLSEVPDGSLAALMESAARLGGEAAGENPAGKNR